MILNRIRVVFVLIAGMLSAGGAAAQSGIADYCLDDELAREHGLVDLYCVNLVAVPALADASGFIRLVPTYSPYGVSVTRDGHHEYRLEFSIEGLPDPSTLGPYSTYVAWATTPLLNPVRKLGTVENGRTTLERVAFNKFIILISAEVSGDVSERSGRLVMRGASPSNRMEAHDLTQTAPLAVFARSVHEHGRAAPAERGEEDQHGQTEQGEEEGRSSRHEGGRHDGAGPSHGHGHDVPAGDAAAWRMPPMHPAEPDLPGMAGIQPKTTPFLPKAAADAPPAAQRTHVQLDDGASFDLEAGYVRRTIQGHDLLMYGFNGQHPGPVLDVEQGSEITVRFRNRLGLPSAVHWHGLRLDFRSDGVPGLTQDLVRTGDEFSYRLRFPDTGIYWYHPHHREDVAMDLGLFANIIVRPPREDYFNPVHREEFLMLDDILLDDEGVVPYGGHTANFMLMGRFGNTFLINGRTDYRLRVEKGEIVRFFVTNASSTRTYNLSLNGAKLKLVGSDVGKFEHEEWIENLVIAPAERYIVEARFAQAGEVAIENRVQAINHTLGRFFPEIDTLGFIEVAAEPVEHDLTAQFDELRANEDVIADIDPFRGEFDRPVDKHLVARLEVQDVPPAVYQMMRFDAVYANPVEWSGTMPMMNWASTGEEVRWILEDGETGKQNMDIDWEFAAGDVVKVRLTNDRDAFHVMQHPIHIHGQRFLVLERDGVRNPNLVWKDTFILPAGSTADILVDLSNPGKWMVHCHIAEHIDSGMMFVFDVN